MLKSIFKVLVMMSILFLMVSCSLGGSSSSSVESPSSPVEDGSKFTVTRSFPTGHELVFTVVNNLDETVVDQFKIPYNPNQSDYYVSLPTYDSSLDLRTVVVLNDSNGISLGAVYSQLDENWSIDVTNGLPTVSGTNNDIITTVNTVTKSLYINFFDYEAGKVYDYLGFNFKPLDITYRFTEIPQNSNISESDINYELLYPGPGYSQAKFSFIPDAEGRYLLEVKCFDGIDSASKVFTIKTPNSEEGVVNVSIN